MPGPHRRGHERSLGLAFASGSLTVKEPVRPAFGLALYSGVLTRLSRPLGALVIFSRACRPSRTAHLPVFWNSCPSKRYSYRRAVLHCRLRSPRRDCFKGSRLRSASIAVPQRQAAVKLHGVFSPRRESPACSLGACVRRVPGWDSGALVDPFMHVGTYPTRHLATLRESELLPAFGGA